MSCNSQKVDLPLCKMPHEMWEYEQLPRHAEVFIRRERVGNEWTKARFGSKLGRFFLPPADSIRASAPNVFRLLFHSATGSPLSHSHKTGWLCSHLISTTDCPWYQVAVSYGKRSLSMSCSKLTGEYR